MIRKMTNSIKHRGPDDEGFLLFSKNANTAICFGGPDTPINVYQSTLSYTPKTEQPDIQEIIPFNQITLLLGHRRLSIVDLSPSGHQPMRLHEESIWITYNGEIFNHLEIRQELETAGYVFYSQSDTEVILNAYRHWGSACLHKFNGMFAFILVDLDRNQLFVARDRFGVKPLYLWESPQGFLAIASEIKQFTLLPGWLANANVSRCLDYLSGGLTDFSNMTLFDGVIQLRGGEYIECELNLNTPPAPKTWYRLKKTPAHLSFQDAASHFHDLFEDSIRLRLRADVDIGSCLSGGLDSSAIVCMANRLLNRSGKKNDKQKTFSACSHIARFDERHYIDEIISQTGVNGHFVTPGVEDLLPMTKQIVWHQDEPFGSSSIYAQYLVFALAKKAHVKVILDGQGADENLAGYNLFWSAHLAQLLKDFRWPSFFKEVNFSQRMRPSFKISTASLLKQLLPSSLKNPLKILLRTKYSISPASNWLNYQEYNAHVPFSKSDGIDHLVDQLAYDQINHTSLPALLRYEDRNSMAHSIEARTPFLDYRLVEFIFNLPAHYKISDGHTKKVMREGLKGILPEKVRTRLDKLGFATAEEVWMCQEKPKLFRSEIAAAIEKSCGLINPKAINMADNIINKRIPFNWSLWRIINFGYWIETFNVRVR